MYLLDTNIVSELRRPKPHGAVVAWLQSLNDAEIFISAVTIGEIQAGIELTRMQDAIKADSLEIWLNQLAGSYNVLPMDATCFKVWGKLMHQQSNTVIEDAMIAATAQAHGLTVVTRNVADMQVFGVPVCNPFEATNA